LCLRHRGRWTAGEGAGLLERRGGEGTGLLERRGGGLGGAATAAALERGRAAAAAALERGRPAAVLERGRGGMRTADASGSRKHEEVLGFLMGLGLAWAAQGTKSTDLVSHVDD
jgi:hypothetical protein